MTSINWPSTLDPLPLLKGAGLSFQETTIRSHNSVGPAKVRSRSTLDLMDHVAPYLFTREEALILRAFWRDDCNRGSTSFNWISPFKLETVEVRFMEKPSMTLSEDYYLVALKIEEV